MNNGIPDATFFVERTTTYFFQCHHCNGRTLVRLDHAMKITYPEVKDETPAREEVQVSEPKPIGEPGRMLTTFHCDNCRTQFDISIWTTLTKKGPMFDSAKLPEKSADQISS